MLTKKNPLLIFLIFLILTSYLSLSDVRSRARLFDNYSNISVTEAYNIIGNTTGLFILDVRTQEEYSTGHIANAELIPHNEIILRQTELPENKSHPLLVYCKSGSRSVSAVNSLADLNYTTLFNMLGGFNAWKDAGYPYETSFIDPTETLMQYLVIFTILGVSIIIFVVILRELYFRKKIRQ